MVSDEHHEGNKYAARCYDEPYIDIPKLKPDGFLVSGSLHLQFDCRNSKAKS